MESKSEGKCDLCRKLASWYNEMDETCKPANKEEAAYKGSQVEIFMFYLSMAFTIFFGVLTLLYRLQPRFLIFLIPLGIWVFLRSSRKDMSATAYLIAGLFGAAGGAFIVILNEIIRGVK